MMYKIYILLAVLFIGIETYGQTPNWLWAHSATGSDNNDFARDVATDMQGNVYLIGDYQSSNLIFANDTLVSAGSNDIFLAKYDNSGNLIWVKGFGRNSYDNGYAISTDPNGNILITGSFASDSLSFGTITLTNSTTSYNVYVAKFDSSGNALWAKSAGGTAADNAFGITTDLNGNVMICGHYGSGSIAFGSYILTNTGSNDIFVVKYDSSGNEVWAKRAGNSDTDSGSKICSDPAGNVFVTGYFESNTIIFGNDTLINASSGTTDFFVVKYDTNGNVLWARKAGGNSPDMGRNLDTDYLGNLFVIGDFSSGSITFGSTVLINYGGSNPYDVFIVKYDPSGNVLWAKRGGGTNWDSGLGITVGLQGNFVVTGYFGSTNIIFGNDTLINGGSRDIFFVKYDSSGTVVWAERLGGIFQDIGYSVCLDGQENIFVTGYFQSSTLIFGNDTVANSSNAAEIFIAKSGNILTNIADVNTTYGVINVFPNPNNGHTIITSSEAIEEIKIFNAQGQMVNHIKLNDDILSLEFDNPGVYFIQVITKKQRITKKLVVFR